MDIRIVVNYFGTPPRVFPLWLNSIGANPSISWILITDIKMDMYSVPTNVKVIETTFLQLKARIQKKFPYPVRYERAWDFCALKPLIGTIFAEELIGADYWGWSDIDMLYGDLSPVIKLASDGYDKVMPNGHFSIVRNSQELNLFVYDHPKSREAIASDGPGVSCYDERDFRFTVLHDFGARQASEIVPYIHLCPRWGHFSFNVSFAANRLLGLDGDVSTPVIFTWCKGQLIGHFAMPDHTVRKLQLAYVHFFRRNIAARVDKLCDDGTVYLISPTGITKWSSDADFSYWEIRWINRPRMHWKYVWDRLNWKTLSRKLQNAKKKLMRRVELNPMVYHADC